MVLGFFPFYLAVKLDISNILNWVRGSTPWGLKRATPSFCKERRLEHLVDSILENAAIDLAILIDKPSLGSIDGVVLVGEQIIVVGSCDIATSHQVVDRIGVIEVCSVNVGSDWEKFGDHISKHVIVEGHAEYMLAIDRLTVIDGGVDGEAIESRELRDRVVNEKSYH